jgi:hypothetical protein
MPRPPVIRHSYASAPGAIVRRACIARSLRPPNRAVSHARSGAKATLAIILATAALTQTSTGAERSEVHFNHTILATTGTATPAGGNYLAFSSIVMSPRGEIAFDASLRGGASGVFLSSDAATNVVALGAQNPVPGSLSGVVSTPFITPHGDVTFFLSESDGPASNAILRKDGASLVPLVQDGDPAPGGGILSLGDGQSIDSILDVSSNGALTFTADVSGGTATRGVFRTDPSGTVAIATDGVPLPTGGTMTQLVHKPAINARGEVAFSTEIDDMAAFGVFRGDGKHLVTIFASSQRAAGVTLTDFGPPLINRQGQVVVVCSIVDSSGLPTLGLFAGDGIETTPIALPGRRAPKGGSYAPSRVIVPILNDRGQVAFNSNLTGATSNTGIFRRDRDSTTTIALQGAIAAGTHGATFEAFGLQAMDEDGRVAFVALLTPDVGDTDASNDMGIWIGTSDVDLHLVVRTGASIAGQTLIQIPGSTLGQGGQIKLVEKAVAWIGRFAGGASSVVVSTVDEHRK